MTPWSDSPGRLVPLACVALVCMIYCGLLSVIPAQGVWVCDEGLKMISAQWIAATGEVTAALPYPGRNIDGACRYLPFPTSDDREAALVTLTPRGPVSVFSPALPLVSAPFFRWFGWPGLYLVPLITACASVWLLYALWHEVSGSRREAALSVLIFGLLSPLWFYAVTFWEHAPAVCAAALGTWCCVRSLRPGSSWFGVLGGLAFGIGTAFREEMLLWGAAVALGYLIVARDWRGALRPVIGCAVGVLPLLVYNLASSGSLLSAHVTTNLRHSLLPDPAVAYHLLICMAASVPVSLALSAPSIAAVVIGLTRRGISGLVPTLLAVAAAVGVAISLLLFRQRHGDLVDLMNINSLAMFVAFPIFAGLSAGSVARTGNIARRWLLVTAGGYVGLCVLTASPWSVMGIHHGPRVLLPAFLVLSGVASSGLLRFLSTRSYGPASLRIAAVATVLFATLAVQLLFGHELLLKKQLSSRLCETVRRAPAEHLVSSLWWAGAELVPVYYEKRIMYSRSAQDELRLLDSLERHGVGRLSFIAPTDDPTVPLSFMSVSLSPPLSIRERRAQLGSAIGHTR